MTGLPTQKSQLAENGFMVTERIFSDAQIEQLLQLIGEADSSKGTFRKSADLFAIRQFLKEIPGVKKLIFNAELMQLIKDLFGTDYFIIKSIYFDKPEQSNWFVSYHQDLTIAVDKKAETEGYSKWTSKQDQFSVQPPIDLLTHIYTIRIHLDETDENNGALKVVPRSHLKGIYRPENIDWATESEYTCAVPKGAVMIMKPLLLHSSARTTNHQKRRVIHIELCNQNLHQGLNWTEHMTLNQL